MGSTNHRAAEADGRYAPAARPLPRPLADVVGRLALFAGGCGAAIGATVLVGWWIGSERLTSVVAGWPPMMANTALLCLFTGIALVLGAWPAPRGWAVAGGKIVAGLVVALAGLTMAEYLTGASLGIDQMVVRTTRVSLTHFPGRPALNTAVGFLQLGVALLLIDARGGRGSRVAQVLAAASGSIATFALLGYLFGVPQFYSVPTVRPQTGMAVHTAIALGILSAGIIMARPRTGFMAVVTDQTAGGVMARRLLPSLGVFVPVALLVLMGERQGWYDRPVVAALLIFCAIVASGIFILVTARRLSVDDAWRIAAEARVRDSERRYRELFEYGSDGVFIANLEGEYTAVNAAGCALLGLPREQIVGRRIVDFIPRADTARLWEDRRRLLEGGTAVSEWMMRRGDGSWVPVEVSAAILADGRWQGFTRDISVRKQQEAELVRARETDRELRDELEHVALQTAQLYAAEAHQRAWLRTTIDQMPEGVALLDGDGRWVEINRAMLAFTRARPGEADPFGNPDILDVRSPAGETLSFEQLPVVRALKRGEICKAEELLVQDAGGRIIPVLVNAAPVRDDEGQIIGATVVLQDISTMKELERLREEWASVIAHDLRQPVGTVRLTAQSLFKVHPGELPEQERRAIERIESTSERLDRMIGDLLDASLIEAKHLSVDCRPVDLGALIDGVVDGLRETLADHHIQVITAHPTALIDPNRIHQVLVNLISNAAKYGRPHSEIRVETSIRNQQVEVTITNWGAGISPDDLPALFGRFRRASGVRADRVPGLGLGLYISKGLVEAHGGRIWADSVPGETTMFHFTVPSAPAAPASG